MEPVDVDNNHLIEFRIAIREVLANRKLDFFEEIPWKEVEKDNSKSCVEGKIYQQKRAPPAKVRGVSKLVQVPRELKEKRLACVEEYSSSLRVRWIEANVQRVLTVDKRSKMKLKPATIKLEINKAVRPSNKWSKNTYGRGYMKADTPYSYCRDFKKEGLTKPRILLRIMLEELRDRFPWTTVFDCTGFYDEWNPVDKNGVTWKTTRGHGLGMASSLTTLMQLGIEGINLKKTGCNLKYSGYYNDDAAVIISDLPSLQRYVRADRETCECLSLLFKTKATFVAQGYAVLCEQYASDLIRDINQKGVYYQQEFANLYKCVNISHARHLSSCMNIGNCEASNVTELIQYWGWVLFRNESNKSIHEAGWWRNIDYGVDVTFFQRNSESEISRESTAAIEAYSIVQKEVKPWLNKTRYDRASRQWLSCLKEYERKGLEDFSADYANLVGLDKPLDQQSMFRPSMDGQEETRSWIAYQRALRATYRVLMSIQTPNLTVKALYEMVCKANPKIDILPPDSECTYVRCRAKVLYNDFIFHHPYQGHGLRLDHEIYSRDEKRNEYNIRSANNGDIRWGYPSELGRNPQDVAFHLTHRACFGYIEGFRPTYYHAVIVPDDRVMPYWHNPFAVVAVSDKWRANKWTGVIPKQWHNRELLELRKNVYSRNLSMEEWTEIGTISPSDQRIVMAVITEDYTTEDIKELCDDLRRYPGLGHLFNYVPDMRNYAGNGTMKLFQKWVNAWNRRKAEDASILAEIDNEGPIMGDSFLLDVDYGDNTVVYVGDEYIEEDYSVIIYDEFGDPEEFEPQVKELIADDYDEFDPDRGADDGLVWDTPYLDIGWKPYEDEDIDFGNIDVTLV
jgi:hypothetical protein